MYVWKLEVNYESLKACFMDVDLMLHADILMTKREEDTKMQIVLIKLTFDFSLQITSKNKIIFVMHCFM